MNPENNNQPNQSPLPPVDPIQPSADPSLSNIPGPYVAPPTPKKPILLWIVLSVIVLAVVGALIYFMFLDNDGYKKTSNTSYDTDSSQSSKDISVSSLQSITFKAPTDMTGFTEVATDAANDQDFTTGTCDLNFGTASAAKLPGENASAILEPQLQVFRDGNSTVSAPVAYTNLILKDASYSDVTYTMPTVQTTITKGASRATLRYSVAILKNGDRAFVSRACANENGAVAQSELDAVEAKAVEILVTKK